MMAISADTLKDVISVFKKNMAWMTNNEVVEKAIDNLVKTDDKMGEDEKKALESVVNTCQKISKANELATKAVNTLCGHIKALLRVFHGQNKLDLDTVKPAIKLYMDSLDAEVLPGLKAAHDAIDEAGKAQLEMKCQLEELHGGLERKITELGQEERGAATAARGVAYGGAAGTTVGVAAILAAINFWNPIGWVAAGAAIAAGTAITFGVAAGVVEGDQIPKLKKIYNTTIGEVKRSSEGLASMIEQTGEFQAQLMEKVVLLEESEDLGKLVLGGTEGLVVEFKESLESLEESCQDYLKGNDDPKKELRW
ncbi:hypothetical protein ACHWQZ_G017632 [Mnemiopsis leidyi]